MNNQNDFLDEVLARLRLHRENSGLSQEDLEDKIGLGPGWISRFESGASIPSLDMLSLILECIGSNLNSFFSDFPEIQIRKLSGRMSAEQKDNGVCVKFQYGRHDATYFLANATTEEFAQVVSVLRETLGKSRNSSGEEESLTAKKDAVVHGFLKAVDLWPTANPSDVWWFVIYRAFCETFNHPASNAGLDLSQSWKRTSGWALEEIVVRHYGPILRASGVTIKIPNNQEKAQIVSGLNAADRIEADKIDVALFGEKDNGEQEFFGVVHVKASFAERRTDDVHMSTLLKGAGFVTPLWTMNCKSSPSARPVNIGELGRSEGRRSAKRKDIEDEGYFTRCFSYNKNTEPSVDSLPSDRRVYVCDFSNADDHFSRFIIRKWQDFFS